MFFFIKKSVVHLDCFLNDEHSFVNEYAPIQKASKYLPKWFKDLPSITQKSVMEIDKISNGKLTNIKGCPGIINALTDGFMIPAWCDIRIDWDDKEYVYQFSDSGSHMGMHPNAQVGKFAENYWILKAESPWVCQFSKKVSIFTLPLTYYHGLDFPLKTIHGIQETSTSHNVISTNQFFFIEKSKERKQFIFNYNTPFLHFVPSREYEYKLACHVDEKHYRDLISSFQPFISFSRRGLKMKIIENRKQK